AFQTRRPDAQKSGGVERIEHRGEPAPDRRRARGRELLGDDDRSEPGKAALAAAQRRRTGDRQNVRKTRIELDQRLRRGVQIGLGMNEERHGVGAVSHARFPSPSPSRMFPTWTNHMMAKPGNTRVWLGEGTRAAGSNGATRLPLRAEPERLSASRARVLGAAQS